MSLRFYYRSSPVASGERWKPTSAASKSQPAAKRAEETPVVQDEQSAIPHNPLPAQASSLCSLANSSSGSAMASPRLALRATPSVEAKQATPVPEQRGPPRAPGAAAARDH